MPGLADLDLGARIKPEKSFALVIGNDNYQSPAWPKLTHAVRDVEAVRTKLLEHGFKVQVALNLTRAQLSDTIEKFFIENGKDPEARLFFWFAGHGASKIIDGVENGYLLPIDATASPDDPAFTLKAYPVARLHFEVLPNVKARHVLAIFDSCFSGAFFSRRAGASPSTVANVNNPVRHIITSGTSGQKVADDGLFRRLFTEALSKTSPADTDGNGWLTGYELGQYLMQQMKAQGALQTPISQSLPADGRLPPGEFVFRMRRGVLGDVKSRPTASPLSQVVSRCIVNKRHASGPRLAAEIAKTIDFDHNRLVQTWKPVADVKPDESLQKAAPHDIFRMEVTDDELQLSYPGGELIVVPVIDTEVLSLEGARTSVLLQGGWRQRGSEGCVEYRFDIASRTGDGKWWIEKRYKYVAPPALFRKTGRPLESHLAIVER